MVIRFDIYNESIRDKMTPKSEEDIIQSLIPLGVQKMFDVGIDRDAMWLIKYALEHGANPNLYKDVKTLGVITEENVTSSVERKELVKLLIEHGVNIHFKSDALLVWCIRKTFIDQEWMDIIKLLIDKGANVNAQKGEALMWACNIENPDLVQLLVDKGADVTLYPNMLSNYSEYGYTKIIKILLDNGEFLQGEKDNALRRACTRGHIDTIKVLIEHGADIHTDEDAPVMISAVNNQIDTVKYLISKGANIQRRNNLPLQRAAYYGHIEMIQLLIDNGADIQDDHNAPLREAVKEGQLEAVKLLLKLGANANDISDFHMKYGEKNRKEIVRLIKQHQWYERKIKKTNESVRDMMTPKSEEDINRIIVDKLKKVKHHITKYSTSDFKHIAELLDEPKRNLYMISSDDSGFDVINKYFNSLVKRTKCIEFDEVDGEKIGNGDVFVMCYPSKKLALWWNDKDNREFQYWVFSKPFYCNKINESVRDKMTPRSEQDIRTNIQKEPIPNQFLKACELGYIDMVKKLFPDIKESKNYYSLAYKGLKNSVLGGHLDVLKYLVDVTRSNWLHYNDDELLRRATERGYTDIVEYLLDNGALIDTQDNNPIWNAVYFGHVDTVQLLLSRGAELDERCFRADNSPEMTAFLSEYE